MKAWAVIPCRKNSTRFPGKNFKDFMGQSLVKRAAVLARQAWSMGLIHGAVVTYDYWDAGLNDLPIRVQSRPEAICKNETTTLEVVQSFVSGTDIDIVCLLLPTSPLRTMRHLIESRLLLTESWHSVMSVTPFRQDVKGILDVSGNRVERISSEVPTPVKHDGTVIWARRDWLVGAKSWYDSERIRPYHVPTHESADIDIETDLKWAEFLLKGQG